MKNIKKENWSVNYGWSAGSGLRLGICDYQSIRVLHDASVPFVYVNYDGDGFGPFTDQLKSKSADIEIREIMHGFDLKVTYDFYGADYQYEHVWRFHEDGQFGSTIVIQGPGEEINGLHTYHIPFRFDIDISGESADSFQRQLASGDWANVGKEGRQLPLASPDPHFDWRVIDKDNAKSALIRARPGDGAEAWPLAYKQSESWSAWGATTGGAPGDPGSVPAIYANDQSVQETDIVLWYIAHVRAVDRVAACGPWFKLDGYPEPAEDDEEDAHHHH